MQLGAWRQKIFIYPACNLHSLYKLLADCLKILKISSASFLKAPQERKLQLLAFCWNCVISKMWSEAGPQVKPPSKLRLAIRTEYDQRLCNTNNQVNLLKSQLQKSCEEVQKLTKDNSALKFSHSELEHKLNRSNNQMNTLILQTQKLHDELQIISKESSRKDLFLLNLNYYFRFYIVPLKSCMWC